MPESGRLIAFACTAWVIIVIPGPSVLFIVARALAGGRRVEILSELGNTLGEYGQVIAVAVGIGALAVRSVALFTGVKLVGGAYLVYLGIATFRKRGRAFPPAGDEARDASPGRPFLQGLVVGATNPKTVIFLAAILPQFVNRSAGDVSGQVLLLGLIFAAVALLSDGVWALAANRFRDWFGRSPRRLELVGGVGGLAIIAIGIRLLVTGRKD